MTLADRVEQASGPDRELFLSVFYEIYGSALQGTIALPYPEYAASFGRFVELLDAEAYLDAAMTLRPEGSRVILNIAEDNITTAIVSGTQGIGDTPALALLAAILRAHEQGGEGDE